MCLNRIDAKEDLLGHPGVVYFILVIGMKSASLRSKVRLSSQ